MAPRLIHSPARAPRSKIERAVGRAGRHHGEILQGLWWPRSPARADPVPCLVTLPVPDAGSEAHFRLAPGRQIEVHPAGKLKAASAARVALDSLGAIAFGGVLRLRCPIPIGLGLGSSTSDVLATLRAVCAACGRQADADMLARLAVRAELASDPLMFDGTVLFAQRDGRVLEHWGHWSPEFLLLSVDTQPRSRGRDTLRLPVPRGAAMLANYTGLLQQARAAFQAQDPAAIAAVATRSAELHQSTIPMRGFDALRALRSASGALGLQIAHSGTVAGLLFDPQIEPRTLEPLLGRIRSLGMATLGFSRTGHHGSPGSA